MRVVLLICVAAASAVAAPKTLPASWKRCKEGEPLFEQCLSEAIEVALADLGANGARELGVFPLDPLFISKVVIEQGSGPVSIDLQFTDLNIYGLRNARVASESVKASFKTPVYLSGKADIAEGLTLKGQYKINGKVLVLPIQGEGECELNLENVTALVDLVCKDETKDGLRYASVDNFKFLLDTTLLKIRMDNLFNGNKELSANMNTFLNENWREIFLELRPAIQDAFGIAFREITNRIFSKVPIDKLLLS
ncbi:Takeout-like [Frankliniella occidentalis]|uniref:Protein takeout-like n=1 Tax=Frankliniella occidentalis TaxID=133901 RepID=A0A9C6U483_FRAOC|nr:protein takeout-like [Frankliniella occidentalis]KAE8749262.1 Takeout-like [Frankliniella occidentalis]